MNEKHSCFFALLILVKNEKCLVTNFKSIRCEEGAVGKIGGTNVAAWSGHLRHEAEGLIYAGRYHFEPSME